MANGVFMHIYISPRKDITRDKVEEKINLGLDWYRYTNEIYIVYTTSDVTKWQGRLLELVDPGGFMFICEFNIRKYNGWMAKDFWDWIEKKR